MANTHLRRMIRDLTWSRSEFLESSKYAITIVRCGSEEFKLFRTIVCPRSKFFAAACNGQFQTKTSTIVLEDDDPPTVRRMLTYLHILDYDDRGEAASIHYYMVNGPKAVTSQALSIMTTPLSAEELSRHAKMMNNVVVCAIAQKYDISELKELATAKFCKLLWREAPSHGLPDIVDAVFETTSIMDPGLRNVVVEFCTHYSTEIVADDRLCSIVKDHGDLGLGMVEKMHAKHVEEKQQLSRKTKQLQAGQKILFLRAHNIKTRLLAMTSEVDSINIPDKSGDVSAHSLAQKSLRRLGTNIRKMHDIANIECWEDTGLEISSPARSTWQQMGVVKLSPLQENQVL